MIVIADKTTMPFPSARDVDCLLLDSEDDLQDLNATPPMGVVAFVITTGEYYISCGDYKWVRFNANKEKTGSLSVANSRVSLSDGGDIRIKDMTIPASADDTYAYVDKDSCIDFGDNFITLEAGFGSGDAAAPAAFIVSNGATVTLNGKNGGIFAKDLGINDGPHCVMINDGSNVTVNGGVYQGGCTAFYVHEGVLTINGGTFECWDEFSYGGNMRHWVLNCNDTNYKNGTAKIIVRGGTFVDFDPSNPQTNDAPSYLADGYKVVAKVKGLHTEYTVVKADAA